MFSLVMTAFVIVRVISVDTTRTEAACRDVNNNKRPFLVCVNVLGLLTDSRIDAVINIRSRRGLIKVAMLTAAVDHCEWIEHVCLTAHITVSHHYIYAL